MINHKRIIITIFLVVGFSLAFISPSMGETEVHPPAEGEPKGPMLEQLVLPIPKSPATLNPYLALDSTEKMINSQVYESLLSFDPVTGKALPRLAAEWAVDRNNLIYVFKLKPKVRWQDGMLFNAEDVVFSFNKILDPDTDAAHLRSYFQDIEKVNKLDDLTVEIRLKRAYYLALEAFGSLPILPEHLFGEGDFNANPYNLNPMGTGPYKVISKPGSGRIELQPNDYYHGSLPEIGEIVFVVAGKNKGKGRLTPDVVSLDPLQWVVSGGATGLPGGGETKSFSSDGGRLKPNLVLHEKGYYRLPPVSVGFSSIMLNLNNPVFWDKNVRLAMAHLLDRERILHTVLLGYGRLVESSFPVNSPDYNHGIEGYTYDLATARQLLRDAGWRDRDRDGVREKNTLELSFKLYAEEGWVTGLKMAIIVKDALNKMGINVRVEKIERNALLEKLREGSYEAALVRLETTPHTDPYQFWHSSQADRGYNFSRFVNTEVDYLLERARLEKDAGSRSKQYVKLQQIIHNEIPVIFLFSHQTLVAISPALRKLDINPSDIYFPFRMRKVKESPGSKD